MSEKETALVGRLRTQLGDLEKAVARVEYLLAKISSSNDEDYLDGVALNMHSFYGGAERIFEAVARELDGSLPTGPEWHMDLLIQMSASLPGTRPAVISPATRYWLEEYRGFRHVVRHLYAFTLKQARIKELAEGVRDCYEALARDVEQLCVFLENLDFD